MLTESNEFFKKEKNKLTSDNFTLTQEKNKLSRDKEKNIDKMRFFKFTI